MQSPEVEGLPTKHGECRECGWDRVRLRGDQCWACWMEEKRQEDE